MLSTVCRIFGLEADLGHAACPELFLMGVTVLRSKSKVRADRTVLSFIIYQLVGSLASLRYKLEYTFSLEYCPSCNRFSFYLVSLAIAEKVKH